LKEIISFKSVKKSNRTYCYFYGKFELPLSSVATLNSNKVASP